MIYYSIAKLSYSNFKYVPADSLVTFEFPNPDIIGSLMILSGPNGYGKTTLFDAIELLLTGSIKTFKADLKSRGKDNYSILANDPQKPMSFSADFQSQDGTVLHIKRVFSFTTEGDCTNLLTIDGKTTDSNELQEILNFNQNLFDLGIYISQRESLSFLQNKYKTRGQEIAEIIDVSFIKHRIDLLQDIKNFLLNKLQELRTPLLEERAELNESIQKFEQQIESQKATNAQPEYERLFFDFEYNFDKESIDISDSFESIIEVVENLKNFSENYENYKNECFNQLIDKLMNWDQDEYFALYNRRFINIIKENTKKIDDLNFIQRATINLKKGKIPLSCSDAYKNLGIHDDDLHTLDYLTAQVQITEKNLGVREASLQKIIDSRTQFLSTYAEGRDSAGLSENTCPLCGTRLNNLLEAIKIAEEQLRRDSSVLQKELRTLKDKQRTACKSIIYIFSGKIIQNYPLGLGIIAEIDNTKIVLKPQGKEDDVYNVLSAGQLNGLALSVLLAVHTVYGKHSGLNLLLIDDPLQTIDEVSAISLTDLLTDQLNQGQIMISTHEEQKAKLFQYKFLQAGYSVKNLNMQGLYLNQ